MPCCLHDVPLHDVTKATYCEIEADCMVFDLEKVNVPLSHNFGKISMLSILNIWFKEHERRQKSGESMTESVPSLPENYILAHDFIQSPEHKHQLMYLKSLPKEDKDTLSPYPPTNLATISMVDEDDFKLLDDVMDISRPKCMVETPMIDMKRLDQTPVQRYNNITVSKFAERMSSTRIRKFYFSQVQSERLQFSVGFAYEYTPQPPGYAEVFESSKHSIRIKNQPLFLSQKNKAILQGVLKQDILYSYDYKDMPDFAHKILKIKPKADPFSNKYLYKQKPPGYEEVLRMSQSQNSVSLSQTMNITPIRTHNPQPMQDISQTFITSFYLEVFAESRGSLLPDPKLDSIRFIVYKVRDDHGKAEQGLVQVGYTSAAYFRSKYSFEIIYVNTEKNLFELITEKIQRSDPDFIIGFECDRGSIGYLIKRAKAINLEISPQISRLFRYGTFTAANKRMGEKIPGRMILSA